MDESFETPDITAGNVKTIKLNHKPSPNFVSEFASGALLTGPTEEQMYFLTFFSECIFIENETGKLAEYNTKEDGAKEITFNLTVEDHDVIHFREDKARITLSRKTLLNLKDLLNRHPI